MDRESHTVTLRNGKQLVCLVCRHERFTDAIQKAAEHNWSFGRQVQGSVCASCGYIHWFWPED